MVEQSQDELVLTRTFDAPRELVFKAWSEPERLMQWWGPKGMPMTRTEMDFRPGGEFFYAIRMPGGGEMWGKFMYREVEAPERIVFVNAFADSAGNIIRNPMSPTWPLEILNHLVLTEEGDRTALRMTGHPLNASAEELATFRAAQAGVQAGFNATLDQLAGFLAQA
jgi:uncharacterized protein YndB with AHSA1/START domain